MLARIDFGAVAATLAALVTLALAAPVGAAHAAGAGPVKPLCQGSSGCGG